MAEPTVEDKLFRAGQEIANLQLKLIAVEKLHHKETRYTLPWSEEYRSYEDIEEALDDWLDNTDDPWIADSHIEDNSLRVVDDVPAEGQITQAEAHEATKPGHPLHEALLRKAQLDSFDCCSECQDIVWDALHGEGSSTSRGMWPCKTAKALGLS